jgi:circadian clock protein KaiB
MTAPLQTSPQGADVRLTLFVTGQTPRSQNAVVNLKQFCDRFLADRYELEVVDLYRDPDRAREAQVVAAPTLVRHRPEPRRIAVGDLSDVDALRSLLVLA